MRRSRVRVTPPAPWDSRKRLSLFFAKQLLINNVIYGKIILLHKVNILLWWVCIFILVKMHSLCFHIRRNRRLCVATIGAMRFSCVASVTHFLFGGRKMKKVVSLFLSILMLANVIICVDLTAYADSVNPSESKQYQMFKADYYSNNFNFDTPSFAKEYYDDMKNDTAFMSFLATWEVGHIATSPSYAMESGMITLKEYYKAVLFDLFAQSNSETGLTDQLLKMVKNSELSYIVSVTKTISKPLSEISQDNISYEGLSKISAQDAADAIKKSGLYQGTEMYGIVTKIAGWAKDAKSLVEVFSKYLAIADLNDGTKEILNIIANDSQNPNELREAAADCV